MIPQADLYYDEDDQYYDEEVDGDYYGDEDYYDEEMGSEEEPDGMFDETDERELQYGQHR